MEEKRAVVNDKIIVVEKGTDSTGTTEPIKEDSGLEEEFSTLQDMENDMQRILAYYCQPNNNFKPEKAFKDLNNYLKTNRRLLYSTISMVVYAYTDEASAVNSGSEQDQFGTLLSNIEKLVAYVDDDHNIAAHKSAAATKVDEESVDETKKAVWKIWDHVNLAHRQYENLKQSDTEYDEKFKKRIAEFQNKLTGEMNAQLLSMVGIFTALAFILFGGISSLESVFSGLNDTNLIKLMIIGCIWGLGMLNVMFVFLFCVGKMTKLKFKSSDNLKASFWQRYPVVCWTDYLLVSLIIILVWFYYCSNQGARTWIDSLIANNPSAVSVVGTIFIIIVIALGFYKIVNLTKATFGDEDE